MILWLSVSFAGIGQRSTADFRIWYRRCSIALALLSRITTVAPPSALT